MKSFKAKLITILMGLALIAIVIGIGYVAIRNTGMWEKVSTIGMDKAELTSQFNIPASGWNLRGYEFTPPSDPNMRCIFVAGSNKGGLACYPATE